MIIFSRNINIGHCTSKFGRCKAFAEIIEVNEVKDSFMTFVIINKSIN